MASGPTAVAGKEQLEASGLEAQASTGSMAVRAKNAKKGGEGVSLW